MKRSTVNGVTYVLHRVEPEDIAPGMLVRGYDGRRVYRVVCEDAGDLIIRNVRHPGIVEISTRASLAAHCYLLVPA